MITKVEIGNAIMYRADCLELLDLLHADALISDPPYGINLHKISSTYRNRYVKAANEYLVHGDDQPFNPAPWLNGFEKVVLWGGNHFCSRLPDARKAPALTRRQQRNRWGILSRCF